MGKVRLNNACALNGSIPTEDDLDLMDIFTNRDDEAPELPLGWTRITVEYRKVNPAFTEMQQVKDGLVRQNYDALSQADQTAEALRAITVQVDALYAGLAADPAYAPSIIEQEAVYISPAERDLKVARRTQNLLKTLGIEPFVSEDDLAQMAEQMQQEASSNLAEAVTTGPLAENDQEEVVGTMQGLTVRRKRRRKMTGLSST